MNGREISTLTLWILKRNLTVSTEETYGKCYDTTESLRKLQKLSANFKIKLPVAYRAL